MKLFSVSDSQCSEIGFALRDYFTLKTVLCKQKNEEFFIFFRPLKTNELRFFLKICQNLISSIDFFGFSGYEDWD